MKNEDKLVITELGMITSIGHDVETACASLRAGIIRPSALPLSVLDESEAEEVAVTGYTIQGITDGYQGAALYQRIGIPTLIDLLRYGNLINKDATYWAEAGMFICVSKARNDEMGIIDEVVATEVPEGLIKGAKLSISIHQCWVMTSGHASVIYALSQAREFIQQGKIKRAIIIGIDSLVNEDAVEYYAEYGRLKTVDTPIGLMPGEAGAAFMVETERDTQNRGAASEVCIGAIATGFEDHNFLSETPAFGKMLSQVMVTAMKTVNHVHTVYTDLNGEDLRAMDWGNALVRAQGQLGYVPEKTILPAESLGDTGASSGAIAVCAAVRSYARDYALGDSCMICSSSESGEVGTMIITKSGRDNL